MGFYIETGGNHDKALWIVNNLHGEPMRCPTYYSGDYYTVCVVSNYAFEAAGICYNKREFDDFQATERDGRPREWVKVPRADIIKACPAVESMLAPKTNPTIVASGVMRTIKDEPDEVD
jgi:hypothetical protein